MREYTREIEYLYNMKKIYKSKGLYPTYFRGWAEEILHLVDNHVALSNLLTNMGYRGKLIDKLTEFYREE